MRTFLLKIVTFKMILMMVMSSSVVRVASIKSAKTFKEQILFFSPSNFSFLFLCFFFMFCLFFLAFLILSSFFPKFFSVLISFFSIFFLIFFSKSSKKKKKKMDIGLDFSKRKKLDFERNLSFVAEILVLGDIIRI